MEARATPWPAGRPAVQAAAARYTWTLASSALNECRKFVLVQGFVPIWNKFLIVLNHVGICSPLDHVLLFARARMRHDQKKIIIQREITVFSAPGY